MALREDFKDEILSSSNPYRTYNIVSSEGDVLYNNVRLNKSYTPQQKGSKFGAKELNEICKAINDIVNVIYPIGSVYTSTKNQNPSELFGGTWELIEKNNPTYILADTKVMNGEGQNRILFDTIPNILNLFDKDFGFKPNSTQLGVSFYNGDYEATTRGIIGADISNSGTNLNILFDANHSGPIRINYGIFAKNTSITIYKWKRTA